MSLTPEALLEAMLRIPSYSGGESELARLLVAEMCERGFRARPPLLAVQSVAASASRA